MTHEQQVDFIAEARRIVRGETMRLATTLHLRACLLALDESHARLQVYEAMYPDPRREAGLRDPDEAR